MSTQGKPPSQSGRPRLVKMVRDDVGDLLVGSQVTYDLIPDDQVLPELRKKLIEEAVEYLTEPSIAELADVYEVLCAIADQEGFGLPAVEAEAKRKVAQRGAFYNGIGMWVHTSAPSESSNLEHTPAEEGDDAESRRGCSR